MDRIAEPTADPSRAKRARDDKPESFLCDLCASVVNQKKSPLAKKLEWATNSSNH